MNPRPKTILVTVAGMVFLCLAFYAFASWRSNGTVGHQRPYRWDAFALPQQVFSNETVIKVVSRVNALVAKTSNGSVTQAVCLDITSAKVDEFPSDSTLK